ncbi:MAG: TonB-dependent receptor [Edaphobacter sp.]
MIESNTSGHISRKSNGCGILICLMLSLLAGTPRMMAQQYLGTLTGTVVDTSGARIANAQLSAKDMVTNFVTKSTTNSTGGYTIPFLAPNTYTLTVEANGFGAQSKTGIVLSISGAVKVDFNLTVGGVGQNIVVSSDSVMLDTQSADVSTTLSTKEVTDTPNVGNNPFVFATMAAGVTTGAYMQSQASTFATQFGGTAIQVGVDGNSGHVRLTLNGIPDDPAERFSGSNYLGFSPPIDSVQEVKTQTTLFDAQYGHGAAVINTVLRSGSNEYHGFASYLFRNTYLDANQYQRVPNQNSTNPAIATHRINDQWEEPDFVITGPLSIPKLYNARDKTFFMVAYDRVQSKSAVAYSSTALLPTQAELAGDFSALCSNFQTNGVCTSGDGIQIYDPLTGDAAGNRTPFPGNIISTNRISAVGSALAKYFPSPNSSTGGATYNYIAQVTTFPQKYFSFVARLDHSFSARNKMNATFFKSILNQLQPNDGYPQPEGITGSDYTVYRNNVGGTIEDVYVVSPSLVVDTRLGVIYHPFGLVFKGLTFPLSSIGINSTGLTYQSFPGISFSDSYAGFAAGAGGQVSTDAVTDPSVLISKAVGKHTVKAGFEANFVRYDVQNPQSGLGTFTFNREFTQQNSLGTCGNSTCTVGGDPNSGNPIASLLLGSPSAGSYANNIAYALQQNYYAAYMQDDWRLNSKLTINLGLRWDYESPFTERYNRLVANFCATCTNPLQSSVPSITLNGGLTFVTSDNRHPYPSDFNTAQPRFGIAYQAAPNTVLRGGFGLVYLNTLETPINYGYSATTSYVATIDNNHPANTFTNPFPAGVVQPTGSSLGLSTSLGQSVSYVDQGHLQPRIMQYSTSIQTQLLSNTVLQIAYVGENSDHLEVSKSINGLPLQYYNQPASSGIATYLTKQVANPFYGVLPSSSSLGAPTVARQSLLVPYPEFTGVTATLASVGSQNYNSLQVTVKKRMSKRFSAQGNFTWLKEMDRNTYLNPGQDTFDQLYRYEDSTPTLIANVIGSYQFGALAAHSHLIQALLGGWQINGVLRAQNGSLVASPGGTVIELASPSLANKSYSKFFNTCYLNAAGIPVVGPTACASANSTPAFRQAVNSYQLATINPYLDGVRQRIHPLLDTSIFKQFKIHESYNFEIRGAFFNTLNTPNFGGPGTGLGTSTFGVVTLNQANDPRLTELTARINF